MESRGKYTMKTTYKVLQQNINASGEYRSSLKQYGKLIQSQM